LGQASLFSWPFVESVCPDEFFILSNNLEVEALSSFLTSYWPNYEGAR